MTGRSVFSVFHRCCSVGMLVWLIGSLHARDSICSCFYTKSIVTGHGNTPTALISSSTIRNITIRQMLFWFVSASVSVGSSDCSWRLCIQSGQDDLLDVVNLRPRCDLLPWFEFTIPSYLILLEGREWKVLWQPRERQSIPDKIWIM